MILRPNVLFRAYVLPLAAVLSLGAVSVASAQQALADARLHYNGGRYAEAVAAAEAVWRDSSSPEAALVLARARLELGRLAGKTDEVDAARELLRQIDPARLTPARLIEWEIGIAEALFLQGQFGPAAELLERLLDAPAVLTMPQRDRLVEWWAQALDRVGQTQLPAEREQTFGRMIVRLEDERARTPPTDGAPYWLAAAARAAGDLDRAWNLAVAGWVYAPRSGASAPKLREDLDRLVLQAIIPELAARQAGLARETKPAIDAMAERAAVWEAIKAAWGPVP